MEKKLVLTKNPNDRTTAKVSAEPTNDLPLRCGCEKSARFLPLYRFAENTMSLLLQHPATIQCAECRQWYVWTGTEWARTSQLDDLDRLPTPG